MYGGIDLHSNNSVMAVIDAQGKQVCRRRLANDLATIERALWPYHEKLRGLVIESTFNWYWLVDGLQERGYVVHLANTTATEQYSGLKYGDDDSDARWLAGKGRPSREPSRGWARLVRENGHDPAMG